ncbi:MAG: hypothetical protein CME06_13650 [Gemmatimonadetes bacterium]|nr:hypothetical protein [Gemmatimonadota bacterium]
MGPPNRAECRRRSTLRADHAFSWRERAARGHRACVDGPGANSIGLVGGTIFRSAAISAVVTLEAEVGSAAVEWGGVAAAAALGEEIRYAAVPGRGERIDRGIGTRAEVGTGGDQQ